MIITIGGYEGRSGGGFVACVGCESGSVDLLEGAPGVRARVGVLVEREQSL